MTDTRPTLDRCSVQEASDKLGVGVTTIKTWAAALGIEGERNAAGKRYFTPEQFSVLETVAALRADDKGLDTITRVIGQPSDDRPSPDRQPSDSRPTGDRQSPDTDLRDLIRVEVSSAIQSNNDLAEKYAHAAHRIGELEAENRMLKDQSTKLLSTGQDHAAEIARLRTEASDRARLTVDIESELRAERAKSWWRRLLG